MISFKNIALVLSIVVFFIGIVSGFKKNPYYYNSVFFTTVLVNSLFELIFWIISNDYFLGITVVTLYRLIFPLYLLLYFFQRKQPWIFYIFFVVLSTIGISYFLKLSISIQFANFGILSFFVSSVLVLLLILLSIRKPNQHSIFLFLLFCLFLFEILLELMLDKLFHFSRLQVGYFQTFFAGFIIVLRSIFIYHYGKKIIYN